MFNILHRLVIHLWIELEVNLLSSALGACPTFLRTGLFIINFWWRLGNGLQLKLTAVPWGNHQSLCMSDNRGLAGWKIPQLYKAPSPDTCSVMEDGNCKALSESAGHAAGSHWCIRGSFNAVTNKLSRDTAHARAARCHVINCVEAGADADEICGLYNLQL